MKEIDIKKKFNMFNKKTGKQDVHRKFKENIESGKKTITEKK
jgi:hypothetical protein